MKHAILTLTAALLIGATGCRTAQGWLGKESPPGVVGTWAYDDNEFGIVRDWAAHQLAPGDAAFLERVRQIPPPTVYLKKTRTVHNGVPYILHKDAGQVVAVYDRRWEAVFFPANDANTAPHPYILRADGIARAHEALHYIEHMLGRPFNADHIGPLFVRPWRSLAQMQRETP